MSGYQKKIFVFGGTHGNEWTGVKVVQHYASELKRLHPTLNLEFILANPEAHKINRRFKDEDLNRAFQFLVESRPDSYEHLRARELKKLIDAQDCFVIDLHTTTANMGKTLILTDYDPLNLYVSEEVMKAFDDARIIGSPDPYKKYLASQSRHSLMIEVGPVPNGVLNGKIIEETVTLLDHVLLSLSRMPDKLSGTLEFYEEKQDVRYPENAYIHRDFQDQDFVPVKGIFTPFRSFNGDNITMMVEEEMFPIFINEAAYYPSQLAFTLCRKNKMEY